MKVEVNEDRDIVLKEVFSGVMLETSEGNRIGICMRDDTFEIHVMPKEQSEYRDWWRVDMQTGCIERLSVSCPPPELSELDECCNGGVDEGT